ncbi:MAG: IS3 family transposase, partial [Thermodesulfovibrionales bacterium]|nr:IS3 family transposase [Thermodesulfovibrionales bacterium]
MRTKRTYSVAFKRQVVEELLSGSATMGQLSRRCEISSGLIGHWKNRYLEGKLVEGKSASVRALEAKIKDLEQMVGRLTMDNELLKKAMEYTLQRRKENSLPITAKELGGVKRGCEMLNLSRSSYYYQGIEDLQEQREEADLRDRIEEIVVEHPRYGYRRVTAQLKREGIIVNHKRVLRIMQEESLI